MFSCKLSGLGDLWQGFLRHGKWTAKPDRLAGFKHLRSLKVDLSRFPRISNINEPNYVTGGVRLWPGGQVRHQAHFL